MSRYAMTAGERTVNDLAARLFGVGPRSELGRRAAEALRKANPFLEHPGSVPAGTLIEVPVVEGVSPVSGLPTVVDLGPAGVLAALRESLDPLREALGQLS